MKNKKFDWRKHWVGMPEFNQNGEKPYHLLIGYHKTTEQVIRIRFKNKRALRSFNLKVNDEFTLADKCFIFKSRRKLARLLNLNISLRTKSLWYPYRKNRVLKFLRYKNEKK